jgi:membrane protein
MNQLSNSPGSRRPPIWVVALAVAALLLEKLRPTDPRRATLAPSRDRGSHTPDTHGSGRSASTPSEIPAKGWKDILWRVYSNLSEHRIVSIAAGVTFFVLLAIFPGIGALVAICAKSRFSG